MDRRAGGTYQLIQLDDFDSSSASTQASEVEIAIFYPAREKMRETSRTITDSWLETAEQGSMNWDRLLKQMRWSLAVM